jgi:hydroxylamine dehydrogenase
MRRRHLDAGRGLPRAHLRGLPHVGSGKEPTSHDVTERLSWETQAPLTVRPQDFKPFPSGTDWQVERQKDEKHLRSCHGDSWINDFYDGLRQGRGGVQRGLLQTGQGQTGRAVRKGLLDKTKFFDERLELQYYELWHHEGRRARMGAMMMAPDYAWWHGFYECKSRFNEYMEEANHLRLSNATGDTTKPVKIFGNK